MNPEPAKIKVLLRAERQIVDQAVYYRRKAPPSIEQRWRSALQQSIRSLETMPARGPYATAAHETGSLRKLPIEGFPDHLLFYQWSETQNTVFIVAVIHGARDLERLMAKWYSN